MRKLPIFIFLIFCIFAVRSEFNPFFDTTICKTLKRTYNGDASELMWRMILKDKSLLSKLLYSFGKESHTWQLFQTVSALSVKDTILSLYLMSMAYNFRMLGESEESYEEWTNTVLITSAGNHFVKFNALGFVLVPLAKYMIYSAPFRLFDAGVGALLFYGGTKLYDAYYETGEEEFTQRLAKGIVKDFKRIQENFDMKNLNQLLVAMGIALSC